MAHLRSKGLILVVDDESDILELIQFNLEREGYSIIGCESGEEAIEHLQISRPDLIILDLMLPGIDGYEVAKEVRSHSETKDIPIIMLTAKGEESDEVIGLELGADDYITKPFSPRILSARVKAIFRRKTKKIENTEGTIIIDEMSIDPVRFEVKISGKPLKLTYTEFSLLNYLAKKPGWVFSRYQIVDALKGEDYVVTERSVDVQVVGLRKKLGEYGSLIETVRGVGYRFKETE